MGHLGREGIGGSRGQGAHHSRQLVPGEVLAKILKVASLAAHSQCLTDRLQGGHLSRRPRIDPDLTESQLGGSSQRGCRRGTRADDAEAIRPRNHVLPEPGISQGCDDPVDVGVLAMQAVRSVDDGVEHPESVHAIGDGGHVVHHGGLQRHGHGPPDPTVLRALPGEELREGLEVDRPAGVLDRYAQQTVGGTVQGRRQRMTDRMAQHGCPARFGGAAHSSSASSASAASSSPGLQTPGLSSQYWLKTSTSSRCAE